MAHINNQSDNDMILDQFPTANEFYKTYWGRKPFVIRGGIKANLFESLIDANTLAGLSLEEDIRSRIVTTAPEGNKWSCEHGPFEDNKFSTLEEKNWSLLVQNVEKYHIDTAKLLEHFNFTPRWLLDDIMVSYSTKGGSVGPHTDSYHVFLVQGEGRRTWRIGSAPIQDENYIEGIDLKVLQNGVEGEEFEVTIGDVIYLPPNFAHEGITLEDAMTFSVGFLGPKMSELYIEYGYYLEANEQHNHRYQGKNLNKDSATQEISEQAKTNIRNEMLGTLNNHSFEDWLVDYFSENEDAY